MTEYGAPQQYPASPQQYPGFSPRPADPGRVLGIVGFVLSFFLVIDIAGLILSIIATVKSRRAGRTNGFAIAGIVISLCGILLVGGLTAVTVPTLVNAAQTCQRLGDGVHQVGNATYTCTPTSFHVQYGTQG
jgi:hypothetical protein